MNRHAAVKTTAWYIKEKRTRHLLCAGCFYLPSVANSQWQTASRADEVNLIPLVLWPGGMFRGGDGASREGIEQQAESFLAGVVVAGKLRRVF